MKLRLSLLVLPFTLTVFAQTSVQLNINHKLGSSSFGLNQTTHNDIGEEFQYTRAEYYLAEFSIIHDGGQILTISPDTIALVHAENFTTIPLGVLNVTSVEGIKFHVGVPASVNHEDPSLWPANHPLAHQSPSMQWGWASGYRFIAIEGNAGLNFDQTLQIHTIGDSNYFETTVMSAGVLSGGQIHVNIDADYSRAFETLTISSGLIVHGFDHEARSVAINFKDFVFSAGDMVAGIEENQTENISVFPTPSSGEVIIQIPAEEIVTNLRIQNLMGEEILSKKIHANENTIQLTLETKGVYLLQIYKGESILKTTRIIIH